MANLPQRFPFTLAAGATLSARLDVRCWSVIVSNFTAQYLEILDANDFVPPNTRQILSLPGVLVGQATFAAPAGIAQPIAVAGQKAYLTYTEQVLPPSGGVVGATALASQVTIERFTKATLPAAGNAGRLALLTDYDRGLWKDIGAAWVSVEGEVFNLKQFNAKGDGVTDDSAAFAAAIAAMPTGTNLYVPNGTYVVSAQGAQCILINKNIRMFGQSLLGTVIQAAAGVAATVDIIGVNIPNGVQGFELGYFRLAAAAGTPGRNGIRFDISGAAQLISNSYIHDLYISQFGAEGIWLVNPTNTDGFFTTTFARCLVYNGMRFQRLGDSVAFEDCVFPKAGAFPALRFSQVVGAQEINIVRCNSVASGGVFIDGPARKVLIKDSQFEVTAAYAGPGAALIDIAGGAAAIVRDLSIVGSLLQVITPGTGDILRLDWVIGANIDDTKFRNDVGGAFAIVATVNAQRVHLGRKNVFSNATDVPLVTPFSIAAGADIDADSAPLEYSQSAISAAVANTVAQTAFNKTYTIPAGVLGIGDVIRVRTRGQVAIAAAASITLTVRLNAVNVSQIASGVVAIANTDWELESDSPVRVNGAAGVLMRGFGIGDVNGVFLSSLLIGPYALDTTVAQVVDVTAQFSVANAGNTALMDQLTVEILKAGQTS